LWRAWALCAVFAALTLPLAACSSGSRGASATLTPAVASPSVSTSSSTTPGTTATANPLAEQNADGQRIYDAVKHLAVDIGPRLAGTPGEVRARDYIEATLRSYGYAVSEQSFGFDASAFLSARVDSGTNAFPAIAFRGSASGSASGSVVDGGIGRPGDVPDEARGKIVLMRRGGIPFNDMVHAAVAKGATAVIVANNASGNLIAEVDPVAIPVVSVTKQSGDALAANAGSADASVKVTVSEPRGTAYNVIAKPASTTKCATVTGGHYDSVAVTGGADDNASGAAAVLEVARLAAAHTLGGDNCFVLFSAEEFGLFGSKEFVQALAPDARTGMRAMLNLDVVGVSSELGLLGDADLVEQARVQAQKAGIEAEAATLPPGAASDHVSFENAGIPVVMFTRADNLIHTPQDAMGRITPQSLHDAAAVAYATLAALNAH
jgi:aminopeptidase YwaD